MNFLTTILLCLVITTRHIYAHPLYFCTYRTVDSIKKVNFSLRFISSFRNEFFK